VTVPIASPRSSTTNAGIGGGPVDAGRAAAAPAATARSTLPAPVPGRMPVTCTWGTCRRSAAPSARSASRSDCMTARSAATGGRGCERGAGGLRSSPGRVANRSRASSRQTARARRRSGASIGSIPRAGSRSAGTSPPDARPTMWSVGSRTVTYRPAGGVVIRGRARCRGPGRLRGPKRDVPVVAQRNGSACGSSAEGSAVGCGPLSMFSKFGGQLVDDVELPFGLYADGTGAVAHRVAQPTYSLPGRCRMSPIQTQVVSETATVASGWGVSGHTRSFANRLDWSWADVGCIPGLHDRC